MNHDIREALHNLLSVMEMQEKRQSGEFHISGETFMGMWSDAKHNAREALAALDREGAGEVERETVEAFCRRLQQRCVDWGAYWRASDDHGVTLTSEQAIDLLRDVLGVDIEIKSATPPAAVPHDESQCWELCGDLGKSAEHARPAPHHPELDPRKLRAEAAAEREGAGKPEPNDGEPDGMLALAMGVAEQRWPHTTDARAWARQWMEHIAKTPTIPTCEETMVGWFANAIMAGYDTATTRAQSADAQDAARYRWLRSRDLDTISKGGVFAGMTPKNVVLNGQDLDAAIDKQREEG